MRGLLLAVVVFAVVYLACAVGLQRRVIYPRPWAPIGLPGVAGLERWTLGPSAEVEAFFLPPRAASGGLHPAIIFAHGNGELIDMWAPAFEVPRSWGVAVLLVEYPGYGRSGGAPSESSIRSVFRAAYDRLAARDDVDGARIFGYGRSLGGGAVCNLARDRELAALMLESTFTSLAPLAARMLVPKWMLLDRFDNLEAVRGFERPVLILHGRDDTLIPSSHAALLHAAAPQSELHLLPCGHNDCPQSWDLIGDFLRRAGVTEVTRR